MQVLNQIWRIDPEQDLEKIFDDFRNSHEYQKWLKSWLADPHNQVGYMKTSEIIKWLVDNMARNGDIDVNDFSVHHTLQNGQPKRIIEIDYKETKEIEPDETKQG